MNRPARIKFGIDELMELVDLFRVSKAGQEKIAEILKQEPSPPDAGVFYRYYNERSKVVELERAFAAKMGAKHALAVNSGTSALIAALVALGVGPGDEVIVPAYSFFACASAIMIAKSIPVITEVDSSLCLDPRALEESITDRTRAIMVVHMVGFPAKMDVLMDIANARGIPVIEDVSQACGGKYKGKFLGTWGTIGCTSLDPYKVIAAGEGGMITTDDEWLYTRAQSYHDTAATWRPDRFGRERRPGELFPGENYRLSEMGGAVGLAQLRKLDSINEATKRLFHRIRTRIELPACAKFVEPNDADGVCGYMVPIVFDTVEQAKTAIATTALRGIAGGGTQGARDWHLYSFWEIVLEQKMATQEGCPFRCPHVKSLPKYSEDMCPRTKDFLFRTAFFALRPTDTDEWADAFADDLSAGLRKALG
jgi:8-amino-3,8-dideoxy-alpha-D-manno-octulosonate transaminase